MFGLKEVQTDDWKTSSMWYNCRFLWYKDGKAWLIMEELFLPLFVTWRFYSAFSDYCIFCCNYGIRMRTAKQSGFYCFFFFSLYSSLKYAVHNNQSTSLSELWFSLIFLQNHIQKNRVVIFLPQLGQGNKVTPRVPQESIWRRWMSLSLLVLLASSSKDHAEAILTDFFLLFPL